jgi:uncharacterized circularly permuted ATP-grasp superfamily protein
MLNGEAMAEERSYFNEMLDNAGNPRAAYARLSEWLDGKPPNYLSRKTREAETIFRRLGITFAVYGAEDATERLIPFDPIPGSSRPPSGVCCPPASTSVSGP